MSSTEDKSSARIIMSTALRSFLSLLLLLVLQPPVVVAVALVNRDAGPASPTNGTSPLLQMEERATKLDREALVAQCLNGGVLKIPACAVEIPTPWACRRSPSPRGAEGWHECL